MRKRLPPKRYEQELLNRLYYHCMVSRWDYVGQVKPYLACIAAAQADIYPRLAASKPEPYHKPF